MMHAMYARLALRVRLFGAARVAKLADAVDLGSTAARRKGSTPFPCTEYPARYVLTPAG